MKIRIGIDPGKQGCIAVQTQEAEMEQFKVVVHSMPLIANEFDVQLLRNILFKYYQPPGDTRDIMVVLENVHAIFGSSAGSTFDFGFGCGLIEGILASFKIPYVKIPPKKWQAVCFQGVPVIEKVGTKAKGSARYDNKAMALVAIKRLYPSQPLTFTAKQSKPQDGLVDSVLLSHYCKLNY